MDTREEFIPYIGSRAGYLSVCTAGGVSNRHWLKAHCINGLTYLLTYSTTSCTPTWLVLILINIYHNIKLINTTAFHTKYNKSSTIMKHTSCGSCFTTGKCSCLTWADQSPLSPLSHSVVALVSGTISMYSSLPGSWVMSAGRLVVVDLCCDVVSQCQ